MRIRCLTCESCLNNITCNIPETPLKQTSIVNCFCYRGWWDGSDYLGINSDDVWEWNSCKDYVKMVKPNTDNRKHQAYLKTLEIANKEKHIVIES
jgi:hypothetical protein